MKKISQWFKGIPLSQKIIFYVAFLVLTWVSVVTGTQAWQSKGQEALNMGQTAVEKKEVHLLKLEKDCEGEKTDVPIEGAKFYLYQVKKTADEQIEGVYTTDEDGKISVALAPGYYYFEEIDPSQGYTFDTDENDKLLKRYPFSVTLGSSNKEAIVVAYNRRKVGHLKVSKEVINQDQSDLTTEQLEQLFDFQITFSDGGSYVYQIDEHEKMILKSGDILRLSHGQEAVFEKIPQGVHYSIVEKPVKSYQAKANNSSGNITEEVSIVHFINTYDEQVGQLEVSKEVVNADGTALTAIQKTQEFEFVLTLGEEQMPFTYTTNKGQEGTLVSGDSFTLQHDEFLTLQGLPIGLTYEVKEKQVADYTSSPSFYNGAIYSKETVRLPFVNQYLTDTEEFGSLSFGKHVIAEEIVVEEVFSFELSFSDEGTYEYQLGKEVYSHKSGDVVTLKHGEQVTFAELPAGITYQIVELESEGYQSELTEVSGAILSHHELSFMFNNHKQEKGYLIIQKEGLGEGFDYDTDFTFNVWINGDKQGESIKLKAGESSSPLELSLGDSWRVQEENLSEAGYQQTSLTNGTGVITKANETITVKQVNCYSGLIMKHLVGEKHWSIPEGKKVSLPTSITVELKSEGVVIATKEVTGPDWKYGFTVPKYDDNGNEIEYYIEEQPVDNFSPIYDDNSLNITNVYLKPVIAKPLVIEKRLVGDKPLEVETFEFRLSPSKQALEIQGSGQANFEPITFTKPGSFVYTITERNKGTLGYTYDESIYTWTVEIKEVDKQLVVASESLMKGNKPYDGDKIVFENRFNKEDLIKEKITIKGSKTWDYGKQAINKRPQSITVLLLANEQVVYQQLVSASNNWQYTFNVDTYDKDGKKIAYTIDEVKVPDYQTTVSGYDLINTYQPKAEKPGKDKPDTPGKGKPKNSVQRLPQSGEQRNLLFTIMGCILIFGSIIILRIKFKKTSK